MIGFLQRLVHWARLLRPSGADFNRGKARLQKAELIPPLGRKMTVDHQRMEQEDTCIWGINAFMLFFFCTAVLVFRDGVKAQVVGPCGSWLVMLLPPRHEVSSVSQCLAHTYFWQVLPSCRDCYTTHLSACFFRYPYGSHFDSVCESRGVNLYCCGILARLANDSEHSWYNLIKWFSLTTED